MQMHVCANVQLPLGVIFAQVAKKRAPCGGVCRVDSCLATHQMDQVQPAAKPTGVNKKVTTKKIPQTRVCVRFKLPNSSFISQI